MVALLLLLVVIASDTSLLTAASAVVPKPELTVGVAKSKALLTPIVLYCDLPDTDTMLELFFLSSNSSTGSL